MKENTEKLFQIEDERGQNALYNPGLGRWRNIIGTISEFECGL